MLVISLFMLVYGSKLCLETMGQTLAALPWLPVGLTYLPVPLGGLLTLLFVLEKLVFGAQNQRAVVTFDHQVEERRGLSMDAFVLLGSFALLMIIGMPVAYSLGLAALVGALWIDLPLDAVMIQIASGVNKFSLLAIPFFVLAGAIMAEGGMSRRLVAFAGVLVGFVRGGLSLVNILASTFFGAISGSSVADTASIGSVMIPEMVKKGYPRDFATALTVSGSIQAILIPPSHNAVIYSMAAGGSISIAALFMAGVLPGLLLGADAGDLLPVAGAQAQLPQGRGDPAAPGAAHRGRCAVGPDDDGHHPRRHPVGRVHGHRIGVDRGAVGLLRHDVHLPRLQVARPAQADAPHRQDGVDRDDPDRLRGQLRLHHDADADPAADHRRADQLHQTSRIVILLCINVLLLVLGTLMDMAALILILTPILLPVVKAVGVDPVHFGMIMIVNLGIGLITPPVGTVLFVGSAVGKLPIEKVVRALLPFFVLLVVVLMIVTYVPQLSLWLPRLVGV